MVRPNHLRKSPRLEAFDYTGPLAAHVVFVTRERLPIFENRTAARICLDALEEARVKHGATIHAYCLMPNHFHALAEVTEITSLQRFVRLFKQLSGYRLKQQLGAHAWQTSYYDHILRKEESLADVAAYIWQNPVKQGLVTRWQDYPYSGLQDAIAQA